MDATDSRGARSAGLRARLRAASYATAGDGRATVARWRAVGAMLALLLCAGTARAAVSSRQPASLLVFPLISVDDGGGVDTLVRLTNVGDAAQPVRCTYVDGSLAAGSAAGFLFTITAGQPLAWRASAGLASLPLEGQPPGSGGTNSGSIPAVPVEPFSGTLRCTAAQADGTPTASDTLIGTATIERGGATPDSATYDATGFLGTGASADAPDVLVLGGEQAEYDACPAELDLQPVLDGALFELGSGGALQRETATTMVLATCSSSPASGGEAATVDLVLTNEFGQEFMAQRALREHLVIDLSHLDTGVAAQSIFTSANAGSPTGNLRITAVSPGSAVLALALTGYRAAGDAGSTHRTALQPQLIGARAVPDLLDLAVPTVTPPPACTGDCDDNGVVAINELVTGVNIALGNQSVSACPAFDANANGSVAINELIAGVNNALNGCA